jgi:FixJ family two-component response regulator
MSSPVNTYIAIVDDDESVCRALGRLLRASGMQAITYTSAEGFLADSAHPQFACMVLDVQLGGMSGLDLQRELAERHDPTPIIFITAHDEPRARAQAESIGCVAYFRKTERGVALLEAIQRAIAPKSDLLRFPLH